MAATLPAARIHYLEPLLIAFAIGVAVYLLRERLALGRLLRLGGSAAPVIVPRLLAALTFLAGAILLFSGATPAVHGRLGWLDRALGLPVIEVSHFFGSLAGAALLILARGLQRRLDAAYHLAIGLLAAGILFSLTKALDWEEAVVLSVMLAALIPSRRYFYRRASVLEERFTPRWIAAIVLVVLGSIALGLISYGKPGIRGDMFWNFSTHGQASRFMRATAGVVALFVVVASSRLLKPARVRPTLPTRAELEAARTAVLASPEAASHLALLGDKALLFDEQRTAFIMYGVSARSWVALGDPVGSPAAADDLVLRFIALSDRHGGWPVFYKVGRGLLHLYLDLGLAVVKLGEEARVRLTDFSMEGAERRNLRRVWRKVVQAGCTFEVAEGDACAALLPELRVISDDWLAHKRTREKRFSLGWFDEAYVRRYPVGVVRQAGRAIAFANVWPSGVCEELEVDLMRFTHDAPPGIMRYLLVELMQWGAARGYRWFNLGMAPLSGLRTSAVRNLWYQLGRTVFGHGERFYNFQGVREFKEWFHPVWEPRYLASPGGALRPVVLANIAGLIAGGAEGVVAR